MKKLVLLSLFLGLSISALCQTTNVTATITDPSAQAWANGTYNIKFSSYPQGPYNYNGTPNWTPTSYSGNLDGTGSFTASIPSNGFITPINTYWNFTVCPHATFTCFTVAIPINGASQNVSSTINAVITSISVPGTLLPLAYSQAEVITQLRAGATYFDTTTSIPRYFDGASWHDWTGGGGGGSAFSAITSGTNSTAAMVVNTGASLSTTGLGTIAATTAPYSGLTGTVPTWNQSTTGNAATSTTTTNITGGVVGSLPYQSGTGVTALLAPNTAATDQVLVSHGSGSVGLAPTLSNAPVLSAANMTSFPTFNQNTTGTAANLTGCTPSTAGSVCYWNGSAWTLLIGNTTATHWLQETSTGVPSWTTPSGGGGTPGGSSGNIQYNNAGAFGGDAFTNDDGAGNLSMLSATMTGTKNGADNFSFTGTSATAPGAHVFQISPAVDVTTPWSLSPAAAPATGYMYAVNTSGVAQQSFVGQVFVQQASDTIASIETECSSPCTLKVTTPQILTIAANHTLSSNVHLQFDADGLWTVNGATFTLTIPGDVTGTLTQHFSGTATVVFGQSQSLVPVEWFGAVGYSTQAGAISGIDSTIPIQNALNAVSSGQILLQAQAYRTTIALSITRSNVGILGTNWGVNETNFTLSGGISEIVSTSASADIVDATGTSGQYLGWNKFENFLLARSVVPTGTSAGLSISFTLGAIVRNVNSVDSVRCFYIHASPSLSGGGVYNSTAQLGYNGVVETTGTFYGFYLDSADGNAENSLTIRDSGFFSNLSSTPTTYGMLLIGSAVNDVDVFAFQTALASYGQAVNYTGGGSGIATQDIHFVFSTNDECLISCFLIQNVSSATSGTVSIYEGWTNVNTSTTGLAAIDIESSVNVTVTGMEIHDTSTGVWAIYGHNSSALNIVNNSIYGPSATQNDAIVLVGTTGSTLSTNKISLFGVGMYFGTSSNNNAISGNAFASVATGMDFETSSANNSGYLNNGFSTVTTPVTDNGGGGNQITRRAVYTVSTLPSASSLMAGTEVIVSDATTFTVGTCTGGGSDYMIAVTNGTAWSCH